MPYKDITLDDDLDLQFLNGDFRLTNTIEQEILLLINATPGSFKQFPLAGVGIVDYLASAGQQGAIRRAIKVNLEADGMVVDTCTVGNDPTDIQVDAHRNEP